MCWSTQVVEGERECTPASLRLQSLSLSLSLSHTHTHTHSHTHTHTANIYYSLLFHGKNGYVDAPHYYVYMHIARFVLFPFLVSGGDINRLTKSLPSSHFCSSHYIYIYALDIPDV